MNVTGHCSTNAVWLYKEISQEQQEKSSKILQMAKKVKLSQEGEDDKPVKLMASSSMNSSVPVYNFTSCSVVFHSN